MWKKFRNHFVIVNWSNKGPGIIEQIRKAKAEHEVPIVVLADPKQNTEFPEQEKFGGVYFIPGEPTGEEVLRCASVQHAHSVIVLSDPKLRDQPDAKSVMTIVAIRRLCVKDGVKQVHIVVEIADPQMVQLADHAGREGDGNIEVVSSSSLGLYLLAQSAVTPGLTKFYEDILTFEEGTNEVYRTAVPRDFIGKSFADLGRWLFESPKKERGQSMILVGVIRQERVFINPTTAEVPSFKEGDGILLISHQRPTL